MRIQYEDRTLFGSTKITLAVERAGVKYETGPPLNQAVDVAWSSVISAVDRQGTLVMAYRENGGPVKEVSIPLPEGIPGNAVVADVRSHLGPRWGAEGEVAAPQPAVPVRRRSGGIGQTVLVFFLIAAVAVCMLVALLAYAVVLALLINEYMLCVYAFVGGAWLFRRGLLQYRNRLAVAGTATAKANSAAIGLAELAGRARGRQPTPAPITGTQSVYWKAEVTQWVKSGNDGHWRTHLKRESAPLDAVELEDETGRITVWCHRAELILQKRKWRSNHDTEIPPTARSLLASIGQKWPPPSDPNHMHLTEERLEEGGPLYVMGTLAECWRVQAAAAKRQGRTPARSQTRSPVVRPGLLRLFPTFFWGFLKGQIPKGLRPRPLSSPDLDPQCVIIWKGDQGRPFIVADRTERETLKSLHRRMWLWILSGAGLMAGTLGYVLHAIFL